MTKLHDTPRVEKSKPTTARHRAEHVARARSRGAEVRTMRREVAMDMFLQILLTYFQKNLSAEEEHVIQW